MSGADDTFGDAFEHHRTVGGVVVAPGAQRVVGDRVTDSIVLPIPRAGGVEAVVFAIMEEDAGSFDAVPRRPDFALVVAVFLVDLPRGAGADDGLGVGGCAHQVVV